MIVITIYLCKKQNSKTKTYLQISIICCKDVSLKTFGVKYDFILKVIFVHKRKLHLCLSLVLLGSDCWGFASPLLIRLQNASSISYSNNRQDVIFSKEKLIPHLIPLNIALSSLTAIIPQCSSFLPSSPCSPRFATVFCRQQQRCFLIYERSI